MATVAVAERPAQQQQPGEQQRVGINDPLEPARAGVQLAREGWQRDVHDGGVEHRHQQAQAQHRERPPTTTIDLRGTARAENAMRSGGGRHSWLLPIDYRRHHIVSKLICQIAYRYRVVIVWKLCYIGALMSIQLDQPLSRHMVKPPAAPAPVPPSLADETGYLLRRTYVYAGQWAASAMPAGVVVRDYEILQTLSDLGPRSQRQLSELLWVNRTTMVKMIDGLERGGLVERRRDPADRRSYALQLTPAGELALSELCAAADHAEAGLTAALTARERKTLCGLLSAIATGGDSAELPAGLAWRAGLLLTLAHHRVRERVNERLNELGITTALYGTLATIEARGPISQQQIADQLGLTGPAIVQTVDRLQAAGLVERQRDPADRRSNALKPTDHGHATLRKARTAIAQINDQLDQSLGGKQQRHELNRLLRKLLRSE